MRTSLLQEQNLDRKSSGEELRTAVRRQVQPGKKCTAGSRQYMLCDQPCLVQRGR